MYGDVVKKYHSSDMDHPTVVCLDCYQETKVSRLLKPDQQIKAAKHHWYCVFKRFRNWLFGVR